MGAVAYGLLYVKGIRCQKVTIGPMVKPNKIKSAGILLPDNPCLIGFTGTGVYDCNIKVLTYMIK